MSKPAPIPSFLHGAVKVVDRDFRCESCRRDGLHGYFEHNWSIRQSGITKAEMRRRQQWGHAGRHYGRCGPGLHHHCDAFCEKPAWLIKEQKS